MKGKYSLNRLLHNNKLMMILSLIAAIAIWASVVYGAGIIEQGVVRVTVPLDMSKSYPGSKGLKNFSESSKQVDIQIKGSRAVVKGGVTQADITVTPDFNVVYGPGDYDVPLKYSKSSTSKLDFEIDRNNMDSVRIHADYELRKSLPMEIDISGITVKDSENAYIGTPKIDGLDNNTVQIIGPQTEVNRIASLAVKVDKQESISETQNYPAVLVAYDSGHNEVDLKYCSFSELDKSRLTVIVPVNVHKSVDFNLKSFTFSNLPSSFANDSSFCTISPNSVELVGPPDQIDAYVNSIKQDGAVGTVDFNAVSLEDKAVTIPLNLPEGIREKNGASAVTLTFNMQGFAAKTLDVPITSSNTRLLNAEGLRVTVSQQNIAGVTIIGPAAVVEQITETDILFTVDMVNNTAAGSHEVVAAATVPNYSDVWAYYGKEQNGHPLYVTVQ